MGRLGRRRRALATGAPHSFIWLMDQSERLIDYAARAGNPRQKFIALQLVETPKRYRCWESKHSRFMKLTAESTTKREQIHHLSHIGVSLIESTALFRYLRENEVRGRDRWTLIQSLHRGNDYVACLLKEHAHYLQGESSGLCTRHLTTKLGDEDSMRWMRWYKSVFDEYYSIYCGAVLAEAKDEPFLPELLLPEAKARVKRVRAAILTSC